MDPSPLNWVLALVSLIALSSAALAVRRIRLLQLALSDACDDRTAALTRAQQLTAAEAASRAERGALGAASQDALLLLDKDKRVTWRNEAARELFGGAMVNPGEAFLDVVRSLELNQVVIDAVRAANPLERQVEVGQRIIRARAVPLDSPEGVAVALQDVTEYLRLGRARRDMVANLSHDLRTPLTTIDLAAETLLDPGSPPDVALTKRLLEGIRAQVGMLSQLSQEIIDLAQIESGQVFLKLVPAPVRPMVERAADNLRPQAEAKNQQINISVADDLSALMDVQQMTRVVTNLLHNAIKFTPEGGVIAISAGRWEREDVMLSVTDTGPGIPKSEQNRVFERFYKQDRARSRGGTGLGLAIAKHIVEGHGGRIWVDSTPGQGASFRFTLPAA